MPVRIACNTELQSSNKCVSSSVLWNLLLQTPFWIADRRPWPISPVQFLTNGSPSYMRVPYVGNRMETYANDTEFNFVTQNWILNTTLSVVAQTWILSQPLAHQSNNQGHGLQICITIVISIAGHWCLHDSVIRIKVYISKLSSMNACSILSWLYTHRTTVYAPVRHWAVCIV